MSIEMIDVIEQVKLLDDKMPQVCVYCGLNYYERPSITHEDDCEWQKLLRLLDIESWPYTV